MNLNITLPTWLDMDQPAEAAIAAIILFLAAGYFLRSRPEAPADASAPPAAPQPQPAPPPHAPPASELHPVPAPTPAHAAHTTPEELGPPLDPAFQAYLSFLSGIRDPAANSPEAAQRAAHWSD